MSEGLIIDDNRQTADALHQMIGVLGFQSRVAYGSSAAMAILGTGFTPKFICLDINMPAVDGMEILAYLRREPRLLGNGRSLVAFGRRGVTPPGTVGGQYDSVLRESLGERSPDAPGRSGLM